MTHVLDGTPRDMVVRRSHFCEIFSVPTSASSFQIVFQAANLKPTP